MEHLDPASQSAVSAADKKLAQRAHVLGQHLTALADCLLSGQGDQPIVYSATFLPVPAGKRQRDGSLTVRSKLRSLLAACDAAPSLLQLKTQEAAEGIARMRANLLRSYDQCKRLYNKHKGRSLSKQESVFSVIVAEFENLLRESVFPYRVTKRIRETAFASLNLVRHPKGFERDGIPRPGDAPIHIMPSEAVALPLNEVVRTYLGKYKARFVERNALEMARDYEPIAEVNDILERLEATLEARKKRRKPATASKASKQKLPSK